MWESDKSSATVSPRLPGTPAKGYFCPELKNVAIEIESDGEEFMPSEGKSCIAELVVNIPESKLTISSGGSAVVDCGFSIKIPAGYRYRTESMVPGLFVSSLDSPRFKLNVFNFGDIHTLTHGQKIARMWIEPVYFFEWIVRQQ